MRKEKIPIDMGPPREIFLIFEFSRFLINKSHEHHPNKNHHVQKVKNKTNSN